MIKGLRGLVLVGVLLCSAVGFAADSPTQPAAQKNGWWIRIHPDKTSCEQISFDIGLNKETAKVWLNWRKGDPTEVDIPDDMRQVFELYVRATAHPAKPAYFCLMFKDNGVHHFSFDNESDHSGRQSDVDKDCN